MLEKIRYLTATLIDSCNAFGKIHHKLIDTALEYHHVDQNFCYLIKLLYHEFCNATITDASINDYDKVKKGVLLGNCLSPLLFNLITYIYTTHKRKSLQ